MSEIKNCLQHSHFFLTVLIYTWPCEKNKMHLDFHDLQAIIQKISYMEIKQKPNAMYFCRFFQSSTWNWCSIKFALSLAQQPDISTPSSKIANSAQAWPSCSYWNGLKLITSARRAFSLSVLNLNGFFLCCFLNLLSACKTHRSSLDLNSRCNKHKNFPRCIFYLSLLSRTSFI